MTTVRAATAADRAKVADSLSSAFSHDPLFAWMMGAEPSASLEPKMRIFFDALLKLDLGRDQLVFTDENTTGAAIWRAPNKWKVPTGDLVRAMPAMLRAFGTKVPRMVSALTAIEKVHPKEEHYYLESSNVRNVPFYARHGFETTGEIVCGKGAPTVTAMWRDPR